MTLLHNSHCCCSYYSLTTSCPQTSGNARDVCVILLFSGWVLDTRAKFVLACLGVVLLGIGIEAMLCIRRKLQKRRILVRMSGVTRRGTAK